MFRATVLKSEPGSLIVLARSKPPNSAGFPVPPPLCVSVFSLGAVGCGKGVLSHSKLENKTKLGGNQWLVSVDGTRNVEQKFRRMLALSYTTIRLKRCSIKPWKSDQMTRMANAHPSESNDRWIQQMSSPTSAGTPHMPIKRNISNASSKQRATTEHRWSWNGVPCVAAPCTQPSWFGDTSWVRMGRRSFGGGWKTPMPLQSLTWTPYGFNSLFGCHLSNRSFHPSPASRWRRTQSRWGTT